MERTTRGFKVAVSNLDELETLRNMFGDDKFQEIIAGMGAQVAQKIREQRNPQTGEFAVVSSFPTVGNELRIEVDASESMHAFLAERLPEIGFHFKKTPDDTAEDSAVMEKKPAPTAFLAHANQDHEFAKRIATALFAKGIHTFVDEWELKGGDSLRQKLEQGMADSTHFLVLLSPVSVTRPWVKLEIDAGLIGMLGARNRFIGLRYGLEAEDLSPFLQTLISRRMAPDSFDKDMEVLVGDITEVSRRPPLGSLPSYAEATVPGLSPAASAIARHFVEHSELGLDCDPQTNIAELTQALCIPEDDVIDAFDELQGLGCVRNSPHLGARNTWTSGPRKRLFVRYDKHWKDWDPAADAVTVARRVHEGAETNVQTIAEKLAWQPRRMNPAVFYLIDRDLVRSSESISHPYVTHWIQSTDQTRRFLKGLS